MSKSLKKAALVVGVAALAFTGIGLFAIPAVTAGMTALTVGSFSITFGTLGMLGLGLVGLGTAPSLDQLLEHTGANARGQAFVDPNAEGAFVFGRTSVPLALVYEELHGINEDRVTGVMAHAWHEIEAYVSLHVEAEAITFSGDEATGDWAGLLEWRRNLGTAGQTAIAISEVAGGEFDWPSDAEFEGVAHSALTWNFFADPSQNKLKGAVPSHVDMVVDAAFLYDPREDPAYGSGSQDFGTPSGWTFNNGNGVLVPLRLLIGERTAGGDLIWGRGAAEGEINLDNFAAMADVADETVDGKPRYRLGGMHLLDGNFEGFVARWEHETGGKIYKSGGIYHIWIPHDDLTPLTTITEDDLLAGVPVQSTIAAGIEGLFNTAVGRYIEPTEGYKGFPYPKVVEPTAVTEDGGPRVLSNDFSWVQDVEIAERTARYKVRRSRFQRAWVIAMDWRGQGPNYAPFTVHTLNIKETGNDAQLVRVVARSEPQQGITVLTLQEEDASIYDDTVALGSPHASNTIPNRINRLGTLVPRYTVGSIGWAADADGKPAGIRGVAGIADRSQVQLVNGRCRVLSTPDDDLRYGLPAIPIISGKTYEIIFKHLSSASSPGLDITMEELNGTMPAGTTHVGPGGEAVVATRTTAVALLASGAFPGTTAIAQRFEYTPTAGTNFATLAFGPNPACTAGVQLDVEWISMTEVGSNVQLLPGVRSPIDTPDLNDAAVETGKIADEAASAHVVNEDSSDDNLTVLFGAGVYGPVGSASFVVPTGETYRLSVEFQAWFVTGVGGSGGNARVLVNGVQVQEDQPIGDAGDSVDKFRAWTYVDDFTAGTHTFTIQARATSGAITKLHATVKIAGHKR